MKSDISRQTFNSKKHYKSVRMQQGRVQIDADWNEQSDITIHRIETEALDLIGGCGGPMHNAAFGISVGADNDDFLLTAGRYYVDGILCENDSVTSFTSQPDFPVLNGGSHIPSDDGNYLAYLDVWQRHIIALDDPQIREIALGGPDTGTRLKTIWQVKLFGAAAGDNCITAFDKLIKANPPSDGMLSAKTESEIASSDPCIVPPGAGFRGLENQLYRVEIHNGGKSFSVTGGGASIAISEIIGDDQVKATGAWQVGQAVEIFSGDAPANLKTRAFAYITSVNSGTLTLNTKFTNLTLDDAPRIRRVEATFKWSRDNGSVVTAIERIEGRDIIVSHTGLDSVIGFAPGQWAEIIDDSHELNNLPGQLAQIAEVDSARRLITLRTEATPLDSGSPDGVNPALHPKLRRWDGAGAVNTDLTTSVSGYIDIEDGVQVRFGEGNYRTGDYWTIAARTATADAQSGKIEWPQDDTSAPLALLPFGIHHHYCPVGFLSFDSVSGFALIDDCRHLFPPVTELTGLFYVSGDGQEAMPDLTQPALLLPLHESLIAGVANGSWPVEGAKVRFQIEKGNGNVMPKGGAPQGDGKTIDIDTDAEGLAACDWHIDSTTQSQQVRATLRNANDKIVHLPIIFTANLSVADEVAYDPGQCKTLQDQKTVQKALDRLSHLVSLYQLSGDSQEVAPGEALQPLRVQAASRCGPVEGVTVRFEVVSGSGTVNGSNAPVDVITDANGVAVCNWALDNTTDYQEVEATLIEDAAHPTVPPTTVRFSATLSRPSRGGCTITVGKGGQFALLDEAIKSLLAERTDAEIADICICLLPGDHELREGLFIQDEKARKIHVKIEGCGRGSRILIRQKPVVAIGLTSFTLRNVEVYTSEPEIFIQFERCGDVTFEGCYLQQENQATPFTTSFIQIARAHRIQITNNVVVASLRITQSPTPPNRVFADLNPNVSELFTIPDRLEYDGKAPDVAETLARLSAAARRSLTAKLRQTLTDLGSLTPDEEEIYNRFMETLSVQTVNSALVLSDLADIRLAALKAATGLAIALMDAQADARLGDNNIAGIVSLYGIPGRSIVSQENMRAISALLKQGGARFLRSSGHLQVHDNLLYKIDVSEETILALKAVATGGANTIERLYRRCSITSNVFAEGSSDFIFEQATLTSNTFDAPADAGVVVADGAIYVGNYATNDFRLFNVSRGNQKAANLFINIADM